MINTKYIYFKVRYKDFKRIYENESLNDFTINAFRALLEVHVFFTFLMEIKTL